jgi:trans-aconitate methyltransferase
VVESLQSWDPDEYDEKAGFVAELGAPVMALLEPQAGERILDLGCGDGVLTERLIAAGCQVVGIDGSEAQVEAARRRGVDARVMDAHALPLTGRSTRSSAMRHSTG